MKITSILFVLVCVLPISGQCAVLTEYDKYEKFSVTCPKTYTDVALNTAYMQVVGKELSAPNKDSWEQKKQPLWMRDVFLPGPIGAGYKPQLWKQCIKYKGATYAWAWGFQPHRASNESVALVDLDGKYVGMHSEGEALSKKTRKWEPVELTIGSITEEILKAIGYLL